MKLNLFLERNLKKQPARVLCKKGVLKNLAKFTGKNLCWSLFLTMLQAYIKKSAFLWVFQNF